MDPLISLKSGNKLQRDPAAETPRLSQKLAGPSRRLAAANAHAICGLPQLRIMPRMPAGVALNRFAAGPGPQCARLFRELARSYEMRQLDAFQLTEKLSGKLGRASRPTQSDRDSEVAAAELVLELAEDSRAVCWLRSMSSARDAAPLRPISCSRDNCFRNRRRMCFLRFRRRSDALCNGTSGLLFLRSAAQTDQRCLVR